MGHNGRVRGFGGGGGSSGSVAADAVTLTPTGDVAATDVQAGIAELASEKATKLDPMGWGMLAPHIAVGGVVTTWIAANRAYYLRHLGGGVTVTKIGVDMGVSSGNISLAICTGSAGRVGPTSRQQTTGAIACPATGWQEVTITSTVMAPGSWTAMSADNATASLIASGAHYATDAFKGINAFENSAHPIPSTPSTAPTNYRPLVWAIA